MITTAVIDENDNLCQYCDVDPYYCENAKHKKENATGAVTECSEFSPRSIRHSYPIKTIRGR